jgi:steroid delta-isomerase-like uncharacterized protein
MLFIVTMLPDQPCVDFYMITPASLVPLIAQRWMEAWNTKDPHAMRALFTADGTYEDMAFKISAQGQQGVATWVQISIDHIPNLHGEILDAFQAGDRVAVRWTFSGTPRMLGSVQGTGKSYRLTVVTIIELSGGDIARATDCYNLADLLQQIELPFDSYPLNASWRKL